MKTLDELGLGLEKGSLVLLDAAPLIYLVEGGTAARAGLLTAFLEASARGEIGLVASTLLWTEVLSRPRAREDARTADGYRRILADSGRLVLIPPDVAIAEEAARLLGAREGLGLADAFHLGTAIVRGAAAVLTNDEAWKAIPLETKRGPGRIQILLVDELAWA